MLYLPRGFTHEAMSMPETHSLHLTISTHYKNTWADLMEELTQAALVRSSKENISWRKSLPKNWLNYMGTTLPPETTPELIANPDHMASQ
jgi:bifunctional lysine-specific demethylase and histidyl-hydroxylase NO66